MTGQDTYQSRFSIVKAIAIILVAVCHSAVRTDLYGFVYLFSLAPFFFVAGYFFKYKYLDRPLLYIGKKLRRLYLPYIGVGIASVLLHNLFCRWHLLAYDFSAKKPILPYDTGDVWQKIALVFQFRWTEQLFKPMWFLFGLCFALLTLYGIFWLWHKVLRCRRAELMSGITVALLAAAGFAGSAAGWWPTIVLWRNFVIVMLTYFGLLYARTESRVPLKWYYAAGSLAVLIALWALGYRLNIASARFGNPALFIAASVAGIYLVLYLADALSHGKGRFKRFMTYLGDHSLEVMILHCLAFKVVALLQIAIYGYPIKYLGYYPVIPIHTEYWFVAYTLVGILLPLGLVRLYERIIGSRCANR